MRWRKKSLSIRALAQETFRTSEVMRLISVKHGVHYLKFYSD